MVINTTVAYLMLRNLSILSDDIVSDLGDGFFVILGTPFTEKDIKKANDANFSVIRSIPSKNGMAYSILYDRNWPTDV